jgi:hypothetical protein
MVNLLPENYKHSGAKQKPKKPAKIKDKKTKGENSEKVYDTGETQAEIKKYRDPEGLTVSKMEFMLWLVKHRKIFINIFYGLLFVISVITWSMFIYTFGHYVLVGMVKDSRLLSELAVFNENIPAVIERQAAKPIKIYNIETFDGGGGLIDTVVRIENPNSRHSARFEYVLLQAGEVIAAEKGFILPDENKYLVSLGNRPADPGQPVKIAFQTMKWHRITAHEYPSWDLYFSQRINFSVADVNFLPGSSSLVSEKIALNELNFTVANNSTYNYHEVDCVILLKSASRIISANKYRIKNFMSEESRPVNLTWPGSLPRIDDILIYPEVDITDESAFIYYQVEAAEEK